SPAVAAPSLRPRSDRSARGSPARNRNSGGSHGSSGPPARAVSNRRRRRASCSRPAMKHGTVASTRPFVLLLRGSTTVFLYCFFGLHFSQSLPALVASMQQGCSHSLPAASAFSQQVVAFAGLHLKQVRPFSAAALQQG